MIRIPRMFNTDKKPAGVGVGDGNGTMFKAKPRPKLERRNAIRNIDYALPSVSSDDCLLLSSSSSSSSTSGLDFSSTKPSSSPAAAAAKQRARSLDIYRLDKNISFRIQGNCPGELEIICRSLGLSGPEDFAIPAAAWENMKVRSSSSGVFPRLSRFDYGDSINRIIEKDGSEDCDFVCTPSVNDAIKRRIEDSRSEDSDFVCTPSVNDAINRKTVNAGSEDSDFVCIPSVNDAINRKTVNAGSKNSDCVCTPSGNDAIKQRIVNVGSKDNGSTVSDSVCTPSVNDAINWNTEGSGLRILEVVATPARSSNGVLSSDKVDLGVRSVRSHNRLRYNHDEVTIENEGGNDLDSRHREESDCSRSNGVIRPPQLAPPPAMSIQRVDSECSTWDILKSFAPDDDRGSEIRDPVSYEDEESIKRDDEDEEDGGEEKDVDYGANNGGLLSGSCSFATTSSDDDSSSPTTMEPYSNISPYGRFRRTISYWEKGGLLGRGSFGSVYEGIADGGFFFAVKEVSLLDQGETLKQSIYQLEQEIALLSQFEHDNIVQYYGTDKDESKLYIFLELVTKGSLLSLYQKYHLQDSQVSAYTRQILHGLKYLHDQNVVHRDIKCANILVDASGSVKLADFGLAKATKLNDVKSCKGTPLWMAPEVVNRRNEGYGLAADIWSLGCTVLEMLTGQFPYTHLEPMAALFRIGKGEQPRVPESLSRDARDFILQCLQVNPNSRPTASQLLDHPFVQRSASTSPYFPNRRA